MSIQGQAPSCDSGLLDAIYSQDCDFYRHQDNLMWGRFQTASTAEAALLFAWHTLDPGPDRTALLIAGTIVVLALCVLALKDLSDAQRHLKRIQQFERALPLPPPERLSRVSGKAVMWLAILVITALNIFLLWRR